MVVTALESVATVSETALTSALTAVISGDAADAEAVTVSAAVADLVEAFPNVALTADKSSEINLSLFVLAAAEPSACVTSLAVTVRVRYRIQYHSK